MNDQLLKLIDVISGSSAIIIAVVSVIVAILTYLRRGKLKVGSFQLEFAQDIKKETETIKRRLSEKIALKDTAERQYLLLREYHAQGLAQSKISFWFSIVFASIGFFVIIVSLLTMNKETIALTQQGRSFISLLAGSIIETVSALFFIQSNKARQLMTNFFDKLRVDRKFEESLSLAEKIPDQIIQSRLKVLLSLNFAQVNYSDDLLMSVLETVEKSNKDPKDKQDNAN